MLSSKDNGFSTISGCYHPKMITGNPSYVYDFVCYLNSPIRLNVHSAVIWNDDVFGFSDDDLGFTHTQLIVKRWRSIKRCKQSELKGLRRNDKPLQCHHHAVNHYRISWMVLPDPRSCRCTASASMSGQVALVITVR